MVIGGKGESGLLRPCPDLLVKGISEVASPVKVRKGRKHAGNEDDDARADAIDEARARDAQVGSYEPCQ